MECLEWFEGKEIRRERYNHLYLDRYVQMLRLNNEVHLHLIIELDQSERKEEEEENVKGRMRDLHIPDKSNRILQIVEFELKYFEYNHVEINILNDNFSDKYDNEYNHSYTYLHKMNMMYHRR